MAKDTEKLIRQLSLISYLMAERRPVTATEIRRDVEGYSDMTEDAFARRFYADRAELTDLGITLTVDRPADGLSEQENYSLAREAFHLPAIAFTDRELASLQTALTLLDGEFAYAEPLRLALQQISWGRPIPRDLPDQRSVGLGITVAAGGHELSQRIAKIDTAIYRRKRIEFDYHTMASDSTETRRVDPYLLLFEGGQFYLVGHSHERGARRMFRLDRIKGKVAYATKAEHDFQWPEDFDAREYANRIPWQLGESVGTAEIWVSDRIAWHVERHFSRYGELVPADDGTGSVFRTAYALPRLIIGWAASFQEHARILGPPALAAEARERLDRLVDAHRGDAAIVVGEADRRRAAERAQAAASVDPDPPRSRAARADAAIRPERFARLVTLASVLIQAGREGRHLPVAEVLDQLQITEGELREDVNVLNVVNFGGGTYVLYAEILPTGVIEVDTEPYSDTFDRPARLLPIEASALVAAIDLIGEHLPGGELQSARRKLEAVLEQDPAQRGLHVNTAAGDDSDHAHLVSRAIDERRLLRLRYVDGQGQASERTVEPYALINGREGWYVSAYDPRPETDAMRHFRLDRMESAELSDERYEPRADLDPIADIEGWPRTGEVGGSRVAHVWITAEQARWVREERTVLAELEEASAGDEASGRGRGSVVVEWSFKGDGYLVKEVLKEAGDAVVLEPADLREAVLAAAERLLVA